MPSLPELEVYRSDFAPRLVGRELTELVPRDWRVVRVDTEGFNKTVVGQKLREIRRYGKWLILDFGLPEQVILHLGLTGKLSLEEMETKAPRFDRFELVFGGETRLVMRDARSLGRLYLQNFDALKQEKALGPDLLDVTRDGFIAALARKRRGARDVLLDQHVVAGIGGKFADEILWQARLHPNTKLDRLDKDQLGELYDITMAVTREAIELGADPERFPSSWLIPHRRTDQICPHCGGPLTERKMGGSESFYCLKDQPAPNPSRSG